MPDENTKVQCPHCSNLIVFTRGKTGRWIGRVVGGAGGGWIGSSLGIAGIGSSLGIAGAIFGVSVAAPFTIPGIIIGAVAGNHFGKRFSKVVCPECGKKIK